MTRPSLIKRGNESAYREQVNNIISYGEDNDLVLNVDKTKEVILDFRRGPSTLQPLTIKGTEVEQADSFKFLGLHVANNLSWTENTAATVKKAQQRLYFIRMLKKAGLSPQPVTLVYRTRGKHPHQRYHGVVWKHYPSSNEL